MIILTIFKEESMLMNSITKSITLFMCLEYLSCIIQMAILSNLLLVIATTMKEEVTSALLMFVEIIGCTHQLVLCIVTLLFVVIHSSIKCPCIGRKWDFVAIVSISCVAFCHALTWPLSWLAWAHLGTLVFSCHFSPQ